MVEQTPVWASAQAVLETETGRSMPHLSARATAAAVAPTVPASAVAADVSTRVPLLRALAEHMRFYCGEVRLLTHTHIHTHTHTYTHTPTHTNTNTNTEFKLIRFRLL